MYGLRVVGASMGRVQPAADAVHYKPTTVGRCGLITVHTVAQHMTPMSCSILREVSAGKPRKLALPFARSGACNCLGDVQDVRESSFMPGACDLTGVTSQRRSRDKLQPVSICCQHSIHTVLLAAASCPAAIRRLPAGEPDVPFAPEKDRQWIASAARAAATRLTTTSRPPTTFAPTAAARMRAESSHRAS